MLVLKHDCNFARVTVFILEKPFMSQPTFLPSTSGYRSDNSASVAHFCQVSGETCIVSARLIAYAQREVTEERSSVEPPSSPSLINRNAQNIVYLGVLLLLLGVIAAIGLVSRKVVLAVIFALMLSLAIAALLLPI